MHFLPVPCYTECRCMLQSGGEGPSGQSHCIQQLSQRDAVRGSGQGPGPAGNSPEYPQLGLRQKPWGTTSRGVTCAPPATFSQMQLETVTKTSISISMARNNNIQTVQVEKRWECRLMPGPRPAGAGTLTELQKYSPTTASKKHRPRYCTESLPSAGRATHTPSAFAEIQARLGIAQQLSSCARRGQAGRGTVCLSTTCTKTIKERYKIGEKGGSWGCKRLRARLRIPAGGSSLHL